MVLAWSASARVMACRTHQAVSYTHLAALARAAEPEAPIFTLYANLSDGSMAYCGAGMTLDESTGADLWQLDWVAPVDPESVVSLIFSDGTTEIEIPLN